MKHVVLFRPSSPSSHHTCYPRKAHFSEFQTFLLHHINHRDISKNFSLKTEPFAAASMSSPHDLDAQKDVTFTTACQIFVIAFLMIIFCITAEVSSKQHPANEALTSADSDGVHLRDHDQDYDINRMFPKIQEHQTKAQSLEFYESEHDPTVRRRAFYHAHHSSDMQGVRREVQ